MTQVLVAENRVEIKGVGKTYSTRSAGDIVAVQDFSLSVRPGEVVSIVGPSGCGKTTVLNMLAGFERATSGELLMNGSRINDPSPVRGVVFQQPALFPWLRISDNMLYGPRSRGEGAGAKARMHEILEAVGLTDFERAYPRELSGGMLQRISIARVLMNNPEVLLLDEPFGALDAQTRLEMQEYVLKVHAMFGTTMVLVTHDIDESIYIADRVVVMSPRPGRILQILDVNEPRPRSRDFLTSMTFVERKRTILDLLSA
jgi:NitT/TauT family transport system ATP-binding protein